AGGGQIFQGNTTKVEELIQAQENPEAYRHLIVRVGGFSARFIYLNKALQNDIISRYRHKC
ncbi:MAG: glycine radical domain-containing protein, partial [Niameybacter sp.]